MPEVGNNRVQLFSSYGTYIRSFGTKGDKQREFNFPRGMAFEVKNDNIVVVDSSNHGVQLFSEQGKFLNQFGSKGTHQLQHPRGLSLDSDGNVIVADKGNRVRLRYFLLVASLCVKLAGRDLSRHPGTVSSMTTFL